MYRGIPLFLAALTSFLATSEEAPKETSASASEMVARLGHEDHGQREAAMAALREMGDAAKAALEKAVAETQDAEVKIRAELLLKEIAMGRDLAQLSREERSIVDLAFEQAEADANSLTIHARGHGSFTLVDIGNRQRLVLREQPYNGSSTMSLTLGGGGMSSSSSGSFSVVSRGGKATCNFRGIAFTITKDALKIDGQTVARDETRRVVFVSKAGKFEKAVKLPAEVEKKEAPAGE